MIWENGWIWHNVVKVANTQELIAIAIKAATNGSRGLEESG